MTNVTIREGLSEFESSKVAVFDNPPTEEEKQKYLKMGYGLEYPSVPFPPRPEIQNNISWFENVFWVIFVVLLVGGILSAVVAVAMLFGRL